MSNQLTILRRVKELKEERALIAVHVKREEAARAAAAADEARRREQESKTTLPKREDKIYDEIIGRVVDCDTIEETKARVLNLEKEHSRLIDAKERTEHVKARLDTELDAALREHRQAVKNKDKYVILTDELDREDAQRMIYKEEIEVEDLFSTSRRKPL